MAKAVKITNAKATKAESVGIGITNQHLSGTASLLQAALADEHIIYIKTRNFHWNVEGMNFGSLHAFFEKQYKEIEIIIDEVAERIRNLGFYAVGSMKGFLEIAHIKEHIQEGTSDKTMLTMLTKDHEEIIRFLREAIDKIDEEYKDVGTADFLTEILEKHEKMAWMLRVHLK